MAVNVPNPRPARRWNVHDNTAGIIAMVAAMAIFITNDMLVKLAGRDMAVSQILFVRGVMATTAMLVLAVALKQLHRVPRGAWPPLLLRMAAEVIATFLYVTALIRVPIGNSTAILQSLPLVLTIYAALVLKEDVRWRRWSAVLVGFVGMLMIVRPGMAGFDAYSLLAVASVFFVAVRDLATRAVPREVSTMNVALLSMIAVTVAGGAVLFVEGGLTPISPFDWALLLAMTVCLSAGFILIVIAMRVGEVSVVTPFRYTILAGAIFYGYVIFDEVPDLLSVVGILLIVGSGVFIFWRERVRAEN